MFAKTHGIIVLDLSGTLYTRIIRTNTVRLERTFAEPLEDSIGLISLNEFTTYRKMRCSIRLGTMNTNQMLNVFTFDPYISKYKSYCTPSDFVNHIQRVDNTLIIVNSSPSNLKT